MSTGTGYNPYRDAAGKFTSPENVGAKVEGDLDAAYAAGDARLVAQIEDYAMDKMPESPLGQKLLEKRYSGTETVTKARKTRLSKEEQALRDNNAKLVREIVELRSEKGDLSFDDANPERAKRRLDEAVSYAEGRGNTHLVGKLSSAKVLPSGSFRRGSGPRVSIDKAIKGYVAEKKIEAGRKEIENSIQAKFNDGSIKVSDLEDGKAIYRDDSGSYSLSVKPGLDQDAFDDLPESVKSKITSMKPSLSIDLARQQFTSAEMEEISTDQQVMDFIVGKEPDLEAKVEPNTTIKGKGQAAVTEGLKNLSAFTQQTNSDFGPKTERDARKKEAAEVIKSAVEERGQNTFAPGRAYANGALISGRTMLSPKAVQEKLTTKQIESITEYSPQPDAVKAKEFLSPKQYAEIFERPTISLRVTPKRTPKAK